MRSNSDRLVDGRYHRTRSRVGPGRSRPSDAEGRADTGLVDRVVLAVGALALTMVLTGVIVAGQLHSRTTSAWERDSAAEAERAAADVISSVSRSVARLGGAAGLISDDGSVPEAQFIAFAETLAVDLGIVGTGLSLVVRHADRAEFEAAHGFEITDRGADGGLHRAEDRELYAPIAAVAPLMPRTAQALGFDHLHDHERSGLLHRAWSHSESVVSEPVTLVSGRRGFLVARALRLTEGRDAELPVGFIAVAFDADTLVQQVEGRTDADIVSIALDGHSLYESPGWSGRTISVSEDSAGATWTVAVRIDQPPSLGLPALIVLASLVLAGGFSTIFVLVRLHESDLGRLAMALQDENQRGAALRRLSERLAATSEPNDVAVAATASGQLIAANWLRVTVMGDDGRQLAAAGDEGVAPHDAETMPLTTGGTDHGSLVVSPPLTALTEVDRSVRMTALNLVASAAARSKRRTEERELAAVLQTMLLPRLPERIHVGAALGVYRPMTATQVGGDWYDAICAGGTGAFVIGDIVGKGVRAAGAMGNLRIATRMVETIADPRAILEPLDAVATDVPDAFLATMAAVVADPEAHEIRLASAGHPPPVIVAGGVAELVRDGLGPPLGLRPPGGRRSATRSWAGPMRIVLYTDGLVERRRQSLDDNIERLRQLVEATAHAPLEELADILPDEMAKLGPQEDDLALLLIDLSTPTPA